MTIDQLIRMLESERETIGGDVEVRVAHQPEYPFEYSIMGVCLRSEAEEPDYEGEDGEPLSESERKEADLPWFSGRDLHSGEPHRECLFLVEGKQVSYGARNAWDACRQPW